MADEIINRIAQSKLITFDLEDFYPDGERITFDIKDWLYEGLILREKDFRNAVENYNWQQHDGHYIALSCSTDAIIPGWAFMLISSRLHTFAKKIVIGDLEQLESAIYQDIITNLDVSSFKDKPVIIKGCSNKPVPQNAYINAVSKIQTVAKSVMYGEACSSVPLFKRK